MSLKTLCRRKLKQNIKEYGTGDNLEIKAQGRKSHLNAEASGTLGGRRFNKKGGSLLRGGGGN